MGILEQEGYQDHELTGEDARDAQLNNLLKKFESPEDNASPAKIKRRLNAMIDLGKKQLKTQIFVNWSN